MSEKSSSGLSLRLMSGLILAPLVLGALIYGDVPFLFMAGIALGISFKEWGAMAKLSPTPVVNALAGYLYLVFCFAAFVWLRQYYPDGAGLALMLMLCIWGSDIGAYFAGKAIGGPKLAPKISPKKTWAGFVGGMVCSAAVAWLYWQYIGPFLSGIFKTDLTVLESASVLPILIVGALITPVGQAGDLLISMEKRKVGVKDTGTLIPGHGGLLDRIDSLLLAAPFFLIAHKVLGL